MASLSSGPQGGQGISSPSFIPYSITKLYTQAQLAAGICYFPRVMGPQKISMILKDGLYTYTWTFSIKGGSNSPQSGALVMFPNTAPTYNPSINYGTDPEGLPTMGCSLVVTQAPTGTKTTRINTFLITENLSGSNYQFKLSMCPFYGIDSSIEVVGTLPPVGSTLTMITEFYRSTPDLRTSGVLLSFSAPSYSVKAFETDIAPISGSSPLDSLIIPFVRFPGQQTIMVVNYNTGYYFSFDVDYGIISQAGGYLGYRSPTPNAKVVQGSIAYGCTISTSSTADPNAIQRPIYIDATTDASDFTRTYRFTFYPFPANPQEPTIQLISGALIGNEEIGVRVYCTYFNTI